MTIGLFYNSLNNVHCRQSNADFASCLDKMQNDDANGFYISGFQFFQVSVNIHIWVDAS